MRFRLRTLLIVIALAPVVLSYLYREYDRQRVETEQAELDRLFYQVLYGGEKKAVGRSGLTVELLPEN